MEEYRGKAKCNFGCTKRARYRAEYKGNLTFACVDHQHKMKDCPPPRRDNDRLTEADDQTWYNV